jgi:hypothetical protein
MSPSSLERTTPSPHDRSRPLPSPLHPLASLHPHLRQQGSFPSSSEYIYILPVHDWPTLLIQRSVLNVKLQLPDNIHLLLLHLLTSPSESPTSSPSPSPIVAHRPPTPSSTRTPLVFNSCANFTNWSKCELSTFVPPVCVQSRKACGCKDALGNVIDTTTQWQSCASEDLCIVQGLRVDLLPDIDSFDGFERLGLSKDDNRTIDVTQDFGQTYAWDIPTNQTTFSTPAVGEKGRANYILRHNGYIHFAETGHVTLPPCLFGCFFYRPFFCPLLLLLQCIRCFLPYCMHPSFTSCCAVDFDCHPLGVDIMPSICSRITTRPSISATLTRPPPPSEDVKSQLAPHFSSRVVMRCIKSRFSHSGTPALRLWARAFLSVVIWWGCRWRRDNRWVGLTSRLSSTMAMTLAAATTLRKWRWTFATVTACASRVCVSATICSSARTARLKRVTVFRVTTAACAKRDTASARMAGMGILATTVVSR